MEAGCAPGALDEPELGYRLRRSAWGQGYATEGAAALVDKAFRDHGAQRVVAETMAVHTASRRVMEKLGFTYEKTAPYKVYGPHVLYRRMCKRENIRA